MYEFAVTPAVTQMRRPGVIITEVAPDSLAEEIDLRPGDRIVRVNGRPVRDYLDFRFQTSGETELIFLVKKNDGETWEIELDREEGEDFGLMFEQIVPRQCANECLFCFCKGNPEDARPSLFVRDEDIRLSFLYGNYTTLSSITPDEMNRIIEQRLSPQYVSVHATDLKTRAYLLGVDEKRADIFPKLRKLLDNQIEIHAQVVLCPEINDGKNLEKTLRDLASFFPRVISTAVVPVALTRYNQDDRLTRVTGEFCKRTIGEVEKLQDEFRKKLGTSFAFLGDEIYLKAGLPVPEQSHYGDYPQIEDGVGMIRTFLNSFEQFFSDLEGEICRARSSKTREQQGTKNGSKAKALIDVRTHPLALRPKTTDPIDETARDVHRGLNGTIITGEMFAPILTGQIEKLNELTGTRLRVLPVPNTYFGGDVAVAGLITGRDILAVKDQILGDFLIVPEHIVKTDEPILLDGMKFDELQDKIARPVYRLDLDGLQNFILGK
ncbi:MAG: DUF512 domain-containing protein [Pyrinomonadaceae bacterium]